MKKPEEGVIDALECGSKCFSLDGGSEDCLFLNVYTKNLLPEKLRPVLIWIHGGDFKTGEGCN